MQKIYTLLLFVLFAFSLNAQLNNCDGKRYIDPIFDEVKVTSDIVYGIGEDATGTQFDLLMDVYEPEGDTDEARPLVIMAHGGSFVFGSRRNPYMIESCTELAKRGYVAVSINYTLWPILFGLPDSLEMLGTVVDAVGDMKTAVRYFRQDVDLGNEFNIEPNIVLVGGLSAGAVMACQVGLMDDEDEKPDFVQTIIDENGGINGNGSHQGYSSNVNGIINLSGGVYRTEWIDADDSPIFSMHGTNDDTVPFNHGLAAGIMSLNGSGSIHPRAEAVGLNSVFVSVEGGGHTNIYTDEQFVDAQAELVDNLYPFLEDIICNFVLSNDNLEETSVSIYPNPSSDQINVELPADVNESYDVLIFDQMGRILKTATNQTAQKLNITKDGLGAGMFYMTIRFDERYNPITRKLIFE